ncbi:hypothetical protein [Pseudomonas sp. CCC3.1]|uniref:hypothetical protein n=1 Tax=Pseudomonas sp. CCC3.1 TaxID=3048607 RepID=UPI002AC8E149|nr:hypothetical protein [Pseudomonas sp. CCC3.1]WPX37662.1 hypothetical protein RHM56_05615 [Pseudomonas sp. CCC3.1]
MDFDKAESRAWMDQVLSWQIEDEYYDDIKRAICTQYEGEIDKGFFLRTSDLVSALNSINVLGLKSLLFGNEDVIGYSATCFTGDLALFGDISPQETSFSVSPISPIVVAGEVHTCVTEPPVTGLVWTITALGGDNAIGTIDSISGKYTAPAAAQITGPMTRVRVTATNALNGYKSSGLISVVKTSLNVNPLVQVATAGLDLKLTLTAGSVKGQPKDIVWDIEDDATGAIITSNLDGTCTYQAGPPVTGKYSWVDTVVASYGNDSSSCAVVVFNGQQNLSITIDADSVRSEKAVESVTLVALNNGGSPIPGVKWALLTGSGSVNENTGVFTVNPQGSYRYAVVTGTLVIPGIITLLGHIILPLPLLTIDRAVELLNG